MDTNQEYQQTLDFLYQFVDYSLTKQLTYSPEKFNLTRMTEFLNALGNPQTAYPIIHVAGTKGKGSTSAMIASILEKAGYKVGLYTSPHLVDYAERIQINRQPISHPEMVALVEELKPAIAKINELTTFEITTALGFLYFLRQAVDIAVVEVGLGGRLDSTNVVSPLVSVITPVSYDHQAILGHSLAEIAAEKAGIIKKGVPVVTATQQSEADEVIARIANQQNSPIYQVGRDILYTPVSHSLNGQSFWLWKADEQPEMDRYLDDSEKTGWFPRSYHLPLLGAHQLENAATAFGAIGVVQSSGFSIPEEAIQSGFASVYWPCRFEMVREEPIVIVDSAHNRDSAQKLRIALDDYFPGKQVTLLFGASEDKDVRGMLIELLPRIKQVIATESVHPRALEAEKICQTVRQMGRPAQAITPLEEAIQATIARAEGGEVMLATGSIFIAAAVRNLIKPLVSGD